MKPIKAKRILVAVLLFVLTAALFSGCSSVRLSYNHADLLIRSVANGYFDWTDEQAAEFKVRLARFHDWHREQELPHYETLFYTAGEKLADGLTQDEISWAMTAVEARARVLAVRAGDDMAPLLATLSPAQLGSLEEKFVENNARFARKYLAGDEDGRLQARTEQLAGVFDDWIGELNSEQRRLIENRLRPSLTFFDLRFQERQRRQHAFIDLLRENRGAPALQPSLRAFLTNWEAAYGEDYTRARSAYQEDLLQLILDLDRTLTAAQRRQAVQRFASLAGDFHKLAQQQARFADSALPGQEGGSLPAL